MNEIANDSAESKYIQKTHDLDKYVKMRAELMQVMKKRQGSLSEAEFSSLINIATAHKFQESRKSTHDDLTGLIKKKEFIDRLKGDMDLCQRTGALLVITAIDLDHFKEVNDALGHDEGDRTLIGFGQILRQHTRRYDEVSRESGDEFAIAQIVPDPETINPEYLAHRINEELHYSGKNKPAGYKIIDASMGVIVWDPKKEPHIQAETLLKKADIAMYNAKETKGTNVIRWKNGMTMPVSQRPRR